MVGRGVAVGIGLGVEVIVEWVGVGEFWTGVEEGVGVGEGVGFWFDEGFC